MIVSDVARAVLVLSLIFVTNLWQLFAVSFLLEALTLLWQPSREAWVPNLVPEGGMVAANSLTLVAAYGMLPVGALGFALLAKVGGVFSRLRSDRHRSGPRLWCRLAHISRLSGADRHHPPSRPGGGATTDGDAPGRPPGAAARLHRGRPLCRRPPDRARDHPGDGRGALRCRGVLRARAAILHRPPGRGSCRVRRTHHRPGVRRRPWDAGSSYRGNASGQARGALRHQPHGHRCGDHRLGDHLECDPRRRLALRRGIGRRRLLRDGLHLSPRGGRERVEGPNLRRALHGRPAPHSSPR